MVIASCGKSDYNARDLNLQGIRSVVCSDIPSDPATNECGQRSYWYEADLGVTGYVTVYGIENREHAIRISEFIRDAKRKNKQEMIPVELSVYSSPRPKGREPSEHLIYHAKL